MVINRQDSKIFKYMNKANLCFDKHRFVLRYQKRLNCKYFFTLLTICFIIMIFNSSSSYATTYTDTLAGHYTNLTGSGRRMGFKFCWKCNER